MLAGSRMQGPHGSTESISINGTLISPVGTWDSKITTVLALAGGIVTLTRDGLKEMQWVGGSGTALDRFLTVIGRVYATSFPSVVGTDVPFATPGSVVPDAVPDWTETCPDS